MTMPVSILLPSLEDLSSVLPSAPTLAREFGYGWNNNTSDCDAEDLARLRRANSLRNSFRRRVRSADILRSPQNTILQEVSLNKLVDVWPPALHTTLHETQHGKYTSSPEPQKLDTQSKQPQPLKEVPDIPSSFGHTSTDSYHSAIQLSYSFFSSSSKCTPTNKRLHTAPAFCSLERTSSDPSPAKDTLPLDRRMNIRLDKLLHAAVRSIQPHDNTTPNSANN